MKRKITSLLILLILVGVNVNAQYTTDGYYSIQNKHVDKNNYLASNGSTDAIAVPDYTTNSNAKLRIVANGEKYNILSNDGAYVLSNKVFIESSATNLNLANSLVEFVEISGYFLIKYNNAATNVNLKSATDVGAGTSTLDNYQWTITRLGDLAAPSPIVSVTSPVAGDDVLPGASVTLKASVTPEEGATISTVVFLIDGVEESTNATDADADSIYEYTWTAPAAEGTYAITAKATSSAAAVTTSDAVSIEVATNPAAISLTWPSAATTILPNKQVTLKAEATPATGNTITGVEFFDGETKLGDGVLNGGVYELDIYFDEITSVSITAKVSDDGSQTATSAPAVDLTTSLTTTIKSAYVNFESAYSVGDWTWKSTKYAAAGLSHVAYDVNKARSAANGVLEIDFSSAIADGADNLSYTVKGLDALPNTGNVYITIHYADDNATPAVAAGPTLASSVLLPTPGTAAANDDGTFKSGSWSKPANDMGANGTDVTIYPAIRFDGNSTAGKLFIDDIVMFYDPNASGYDATAPTVPTNLAVPTVQADQITLTWDEGVDAGIGIEKTYILRTATTDAAPELIAQVGYAAAGLPEGLGAVGNWTVIGSVPLGTKTFTDNTIIDGNTGSYNYAIVHRDYAYNYSVAATITNGGATQLNKAMHSVNCYGVKGAVQFSSLQLGEEVAIYSLSGVQMYAAQVTSSDMRVDLPQGLYVVKTADAVRKVAVK